MEASVVQWLRYRTRTLGTQVQIPIHAMQWCICPGTWGNPCLRAQLIWSHGGAKSAPHETRCLPLPQPTHIVGGDNVGKGNGVGAAGAPAAAASFPFSQWRSSLLFPSLTASLALQVQGRAYLPVPATAAPGKPQVHCAETGRATCWLLFPSPAASLPLWVHQQASLLFQSLYPQCQGCCGCTMQRWEEKLAGFSPCPSHTLRVLLGREEGLAAAQSASLSCPSSSLSVRKSPAGSGKWGFGGNVWGRGTTAQVGGARRRL
uniref:Uncharacterized protein n=1 Tax=Sphaerodactylus townsendi TaxID=933632 RepID=A0ACB8GBK1_9SAUR